MHNEKGWKYNYMSQFTTDFLMSATRHLARLAISPVAPFTNMV